MTINIPEKVRDCLKNYTKLNLFYQDLIKNGEINHVELSIIFEHVEKLFIEPAILIENVIAQNIDDFFCQPDFLEEAVSAIIKDRKRDSRAYFFAASLEIFLDNAAVAVNGDEQKQLMLFKCFLVFAKSVWFSIYVPNKITLCLKRYKKIDVFYKQCLEAREIKSDELALIFWCVDKVLRNSELLIDEVIEKVIKESFVDSQFAEKTAAAVLSKGNENDPSLFFATQLSFFITLCEKILNCEEARKFFLKKNYLVFIKIIWESRLNNQ